MVEAMEGHRVMVVTIIKIPKPLKRKMAIENPHQFHVKVTRERKVELKMLAARRRDTLRAMLSAALVEFLASPPAELAPAHAPKGADRIVFKVEPDLAARVHDLVEKLGAPAQTVITAAIDAYSAKYDQLK